MKMNWMWATEATRDEVVGEMGWESRMKYCLFPALLPGSCLMGELRASSLMTSFNIHGALIMFPVLYIPMTPSTE
jgi:hypothetical protein